MTKRKILYGYQIRGGALEIVPEEQRVVHNAIANGGKYDDGADFADKYSIALEGDVLTLTSTTNPASVSVYKRTTIPDEVRNSPQTKASAEETVRPL